MGNLCEAYMGNIEQVLSNTCWIQMLKVTLRRGRVGGKKNDSDELASELISLDAHLARREVPCLAEALAAEYTD